MFMHYFPFTTLILFPDYMDKFFAYPIDPDGFLCGPFCFPTNLGSFFSFLNGLFITRPPMLPSCLIS